MSAITLLIRPEHFDFRRRSLLGWIGQHTSQIVSIR